jgi:hypothetical protein
MAMRTMGHRMDTLGHAPGRITHHQVEVLVKRGPRSAAGKDNHWSTRTTAAKTGLSQNPKTFVRTKSADETLETLDAYFQRIIDSGR